MDFLFLVLAMFFGSFFGNVIWNYLWQLDRSRAVSGMIITALSIPLSLYLRDLCKAGSLGGAQFALLIFVLFVGWFMANLTHKAASARAHGSF